MRLAKQQYNIMLEHILVNIPENNIAIEYTGEQLLNKADALLLHLLAM